MVRLATDSDRKIYSIVRLSKQFDDWRNSNARESKRGLDYYHASKLIDLLSRSECLPYNSSGDHQSLFCIVETEDWDKFYNKPKQLKFI